jgi:oligopeptide/dipeptide ABC transporter ATP-binding protein
MTEGGLAVTRWWSTIILMTALVLLGGVAPDVNAFDKDTLVIALDTLGAQVMDPILESRPPHAHYQAPIWDSLVGFDVDKGGIGPGVAERWQRAADGKSWTFYLRKGLRFHNGDPVTAQDVKFSLERTMSPESITSGAAALRRAVDRIEVVDEHTVRVYTKGAIPYFAASLSRAVFMEGSVMPKKYLETVGVKGFREKPVGSGPWKFIRSIPGDRIEYEAVPGHWRGTPHFKRMVILLVPEQATRLAMVRTLVVNRRVSAVQKRARVAEVLQQVGLPADSASRYPHEFSGGQRQRIALASALASSPDLIVLDEPVSALDVSIRAQIMNLLKDLQAQQDLAYLLVAHNLATVRYIAHRTAVMYLGRVVEHAETEALYERPRHPYTQALFAAALPADPDAPRTEIVLSGEVPSPIDPPAGCHFHPRCPVAMDDCARVAPVLKAVAPGHLAACHRC